MRRSGRLLSGSEANQLIHVAVNSKPAMSNPGPEGRMWRSRSFVRPSLGFRCSKSILQTDNLSFF